MQSRILFGIIFTALAISCSTKGHDPSDQLTPKEEDAIMQSIIRYAAKAPENIPADQRFSSKYDSYYREKIKEARFERYAVKGDDYYFLISQIAPSLVEKRHATGGRFKLNDKGELTEYEEVFRTWKMVPDTLKRRSSLLFDRMVNGESLEPYLTKNSKGEEYVEFPDDRVFYNVKERAWRTRE